MIIKILASILCLSGIILAGQNNTTRINPNAAGTGYARAIADSVIASDSSALADTLKKPARPVIQLDQIPAEQGPLTSSLIKADQFGMSDYRFAGDMFTRFPFAFLRELGSPGQPAEITMYGAGFNQLGFFHDGILMNNRLLNTGNLFDIQSEQIDSIEILPSPRGFLYGPFNNQAAVNFISREDFSPSHQSAPYSRIRYYQAPNDEAMADFIYSSRFFRRLNVSFELTNQTFGNQATVNQTTARFINSDYSLWNISFKTKYLLSDFYNVQFGYNYIKSRTGLFGGLSRRYADSVLALGSMDDRTAVVDVSDRYQKQTTGTYFLQLLAKPFPGSSIDLNAYYNDNLYEFRLNESSPDTAAYKIRENTVIRTLGAAFRSYYNAGPFNIGFLSSFEKNNINAPLNKMNLYKVDFSYTAFSASFTAALSLLDSTVIPSVFGKYLLYNDKNYPGAGADLVIRLSDAGRIYAGYSVFSQPLNFIESGFKRYFSSTIFTPPSEKKVASAQAGLNLRMNNLKMDINVFSRTVSNDPVALISPVQNPAVKEFSDIRFMDNTLYGAGAAFTWNIYKIWLEPSFAYYFNKRTSLKKYDLPEYTMNGGIYYRDTLFNNNLHLKAGIYLSMTGPQDFYTYDFENMMRVKPYGNDLKTYGSISPSLRLDFRITAEVQKKAVLFFTLENLLDNLYFVVPYYFVPGRGIRVGFSWEFLN
ncbi:MAG: TonB-dependent receptor plug domain-containing protein [Syntrophothermus sp.]